MNICRIEDGVSDLNVYETDEGRVDITVRASVRNPEYSIPEGLTDLQEMEYMVKHYDKLYMPWDNHHAKERFDSILPIQAIEIIEAMRVDGVLVPDNVIPTLWKMIDADLVGVEPSLGDMNEAHPL